MDAPLLPEPDGAPSSVNEPDLVLGGERPAADSLTGVLAQLQQRASAEDAKESLDFDSDYDQRRRWSSLAHERKCWGYSGASLTQWILTLVLGVSVGLIAFVMKQGIEELQLAKVSAIERLINPCAESAAACADLGEQEQRARRRERGQDGAAARRERDVARRRRRHGERERGDVRAGGADGSRGGGAPGRRGDAERAAGRANDGEDGLRGAASNAGVVLGGRGADGAAEGGGVSREGERRGREGKV